MKKTRRFSIGKKLYLFTGTIFMLAAILIVLIAYFINAGRIDSYFKELTFDTARNFASLVDGDYLNTLSEAARSEEFQALREKAEEEDNEALIEDFLREKGLWEGYTKNRALLNQYLTNMEQVKYLYIVDCENPEDLYDMYLLDDYETPLYETGYYELREEAFLGMDLAKGTEPTISQGDWGWLCSSLYPVYASDGTPVCQVGCDVGMDDIMKERHTHLIYMILAAVITTLVILIGLIFFMRRVVISPLMLITREMKKFKPTEEHDYEAAGVIDLNLNRQDEIGDIYEGIRSMQISILDSLRDILKIQREKEKAEDDVQRKNREIGEISRDAYRDSLTGVRSKAAYMKKAEELNTAIQRGGNSPFAVVMIDVNFLKEINDTYGHSHGDEYLRGCCRIICDVYKHSPVYRVGGDEFVAILRGSDYRNRAEKLSDLRDRFEEAYESKQGDPWRHYSAASGMADFASDDNTFELVFKRADQQMYENKTAFKKAHGIEKGTR